MATVEEYVQDHHQRIGGIEGDLRFLDKEISKIKKESAEELPMYLAKTPKAMQEQLEKMGVFTKEQPGLQDDFDNAFRMFTQVNEFGQLIQGLTGAHGPASLIELYQTMDLRGLIWNYGLGWISALKGGYNVGVESGKDSAKKIIQEVKEGTRIPNSKDLLENLKYSDELENYYKSREWEKQNELERESDKLAFYHKTRKNDFNTKVNGMKFLEKKAYFDLLKIKNDIKELKAQQPKSLKSIQRYWV